jgi:peptidoglycan/LPS O-acetylase OafA/YrhL
MTSTWPAFIAPQVATISWPRTTGAACTQQRTPALCDADVLTLRLTGPVTPPTSRSKRFDIQGLRAIAVLVVVAFHAGLGLPGGFVGVDIFFVISGFVITTMLDREWQQRGSIRFKNFYIRRFKRLTPALALMVAVTMFFAIAIVSPSGPQQATGKTAVGAMGLAANLVIARTTGGYFGEDAEANPLLHTWSLSVEEQFYLLLPSLIVCGWILARKRGLALSPFVALAAVASLSFALAVAGSVGVSVPGFQSLLGFYSPVTRAWEFAVGALLALAVAHRSPRSRQLPSVLGISGLGLLVASVVLINDRTPFPGLWTVLPVAGTLLLLFSGLDGTAPTSRLLSTRPMVALGDWSYSIYLWHWPFICFAGLLWNRNSWALFAAALASIVPAVLSYKYVEQPIRDMSPPIPRRWVVLVATTLIPPLVLGGLVVTGATNGWWSNSVRQLQAATIPRTIANAYGCDDRRPLGPAISDLCVWNRDAHSQPIYLVGDSQSAQFSEGFIQAANSLHRPLYIAAANACPFVALGFFRDLLTGRDNSACKNYVDRSLHYLAEAPSGIVVIANADSYWFDNEFEVGTSSANISIEPRTKLAAFRIDLLRTVDEIRKAGHKVLLVQTVPHWYSDTAGNIWDPRLCTNVAAISGNCSAERPLADALADRKSVRLVLAETAEAAKAGVWDPAIPLCPAQTCSTNAPSFGRYRDRGHISIRQSSELARDIEWALDEIGLTPGGY